MRVTSIVVTIAAIAMPMFAATAPPLPAFAPIGITANQTARINVYFSAQPRGYPPGPCAGALELRFYDSTGNVLARRNVRMEPTAVEHLEFTPARGTEGRLPVRADFSWVTVPPGPCRTNVIGNVEVFSNTTGETQFVLPGVIFAFQEVDN